MEGAEVKREGEELMATRAARILSVNVGAVREFEYNGRPARSGIWKSPVAGRIAARGINLDGERWEIGTTVLEVSEPRSPCWPLGVRMNDQLFPRRFTEASRPGTYLRS